MQLQSHIMLRVLSLGLNWLSEGKLGKGMSWRHRHKSLSLPATGVGRTGETASRTGTGGADAAGAVGGSQLCDKRLRNGLRVAWLARTFCRREL